MSKIIIIPGEPEPASQNSLRSTALWELMVVDSIKAHIETVRRVQELRRSCGVTSGASGRIQVRIPSRYVMD